MTSNNALLEVHGVNYQLNKEGRLQDHDVWTDEVAIALAENDGISLQDDHWRIIFLLRDFYKEFNHSPIMKLFLKEVNNKIGAKIADPDYLNKLFPDGVLIQSTKIAGVPGPHKASLIKDVKKVVSINNNQTKKNQGNEKNKKFEFDGNVCHLTKEGNLIEHYIWSEELAEYLAQKEGIKLTDDHWVVIQFMRNFYQEYLISPMVKLLIKHMKEAIGEEKSNKDYLYKLFPEGPSKQGSRIAGLPYPVGCID